MPTFINHGTGEKDDLLTFLRKHLPHNMYTQECEEEGTPFWKVGPTVSYDFYHSGDEGDILVALIDVDKPTTIFVYDESFVADFMDLATRYEAYNRNAAITVISETLKSE